MNLFNKNKKFMTGKFTKKMKIIVFFLCQNFGISKKCTIFVIQSRTIL